VLNPILFPESLTVLSRLRRPVCLVTNIDNNEIQSAVKYLDLHFDHVVTSEDCRAYKPRQEVFETALSRLNLAAGEVLHIGDSWSGDVSGASRAGIPVLWIDRRHKPVNDPLIKPDYIAGDLTGLLSVCGDGG
jgi:2-haloacid dehalogenase/putative hydrolase of the HAD superfamily